MERGWLERVFPPDFAPYEPIPCTVLDPFVGSGTTAGVALALGRSALGIDLSEQYLELARERIPQIQAKYAAEREKAARERAEEEQRRQQLSLFE